MDFLVRANAKVELRRKLNEFVGTDFEIFFHRLMQLRDPSFVPVGVHQGDQGADGLSLHNRNLYACYCSSTSDAAKMQVKFRKDVASAVRHRRNEFDTFVFVHNNTGGVNPDLSTTIANARDAHPDIRFRYYGEPWLCREFGQLKQDEMEELLGFELQVRVLTFQMGLDELEPLLDELQKHRVSAPGPGTVPKPSKGKLNYNELSDEYHDALKVGFTHSYKVEAYYGGLLDTNEHDEVAAGFNRYYRELRQRDLPASVIMSELEDYVLGNGKVPLQKQLAAYVVLAHFFERCHIFDNPPESWSRDAQEGS